MNIIIKFSLCFLGLCLLALTAGCQNERAEIQSIEPQASLFAEDIAKEIEQSTPKSLNIPLGLAAKFDITYQGAFRVLAKGESSSSYAVGAIAYNRDNNSIFMAGHDHHRAIAEFEIPDQLSLDPKAANIVKAKVLQNYVKALNKKKVGNKTDKITGLLYYQGKLLVNSEIWYDASGKNKDNLQVISDANDLKGADYKGMLQLQGAAKVAGYMSEIPDDLQKALGGKYISGWASNYSITSRYSQGPSLYVFNPEDAIKANLDGDRTIPSTPKMVFPFQGGKVLVQGGDKYSDDVSPIWSSMADARFGFIVPNANIFMVIGYQGGLHGGIGYKIVQDTGRLCGGGCTKEAKDNYNYFWLFDINEIINAEEPHKIRPFSYGKWSHPYDKNGANKIIGGTFDSENNRLFLTLKGAGRTGEYDRPPLILSYKITAKVK